MVGRRPLEANIPGSSPGSATIWDLGHCPGRMPARPDLARSDAKGFICNQVFQKGDRKRKN